MTFTKDAFEKSTLDAWRVYTASLETSLERLEAEMDEAAVMSDICTDEWCAATGHVIDELGNALFTISEPRWADDSDSRKIKILKRRLYDLYARHKGYARA